MKWDTQVVFGLEGIAEAVRLLADGGLAALPTETVYGLGASALDSLACAKIFEVKERPLSDPLIVHLPDRDWLEKLAQPNALAWRLTEKFWPGPLTVVLPRREIVPDIVTAGQETVALRMSVHPVFQSVATALGQPIAAPSANRFGRISPTNAAHVVSELGGRIPLVLDGGSCAHGIESTIVRVRGGESEGGDGIEILRHGPVTAGQLAEFGRVLAGSGAVAAPGSMESHYAPGTPMRLLGEAQTFSPPDAARAGLLAWKGLGDEVEKKYLHIERLSPGGDLREAAVNLYGAMRRLDEAGLDLIVAEPVPEYGLGVAIMERLRKAAAAGRDFQR